MKDHGKIKFFFLDTEFTYEDDISTKNAISKRYWKDLEWKTISLNIPLGFFFGKWVYWMESQHFWVNSGPILYCVFFYSWLAFVFGENLYVAEELWFDWLGSLERGAVAPGVTRRNQP